MTPHHSCSGCGLCLLVCPVWRETRDQRLTPKGRAKAIQHGAARAEVATSAASCLLCGACEPACPEALPLVDMVMALRGSPLPAVSASRTERTQCMLIAGALDAERRTKVLALLGEGFALAQDDGGDIAQELESGAAISAERLERFLEPLRSAKRVVVAEGLLIRFLRRWLPGVSVCGTGEALLSAVRGKLRTDDLYVIESRSYNLDQQRLVGRYDALRAASGCHMNLDLQRIALPAARQGEWILEGRAVERIVVEDLADRAAFAFSGKPVLHVADLA